MEELAEETTALIEAGLRLGTEPRRKLIKTLKEAGTLRDLYPEKHYREQDLSLNTHLGVGGAMSTERVQYPEGVKTIILSYKSAAGAVAAIRRQNLKIVGFTYTHSCKLRVDNPTTMGGK